MAFTVMLMILFPLPDEQCDTKVIFEAASMLAGNAKRDVGNATPVRMSKCTYAGRVARQAWERTSVVILRVTRSSSTQYNQQMRIRAMPAHWLHHSGPSMQSV